jgi:hypothetical protein
MSVKVQSVIGICLAAILPTHEVAHAKCNPPTESHLIEVVVNSCERSADNRGALVDAQVFAEMVIPFSGYQAYPDPTDWRIEGDCVSANSHTHQGHQTYDR